MKAFIFNSNELQRLKRSFTYIKPYRSKFIITLLCILAGVGFVSIQPLIWAKMLSSLFEKDFGKLVTMLVGLILVFAAQMGFEFMKTLISKTMNERIVFDIKKDMYQKIMDLPVKAFDEIRVGEFMSRLNGDASALSALISNNLMTLIVDVFRLVLVGSIALSISIPLAIFMIIMVPLMVLINLFYGKKMRKVSEVLMKTNDSYFSNMSESISGIREIKILGIKAKKVSEFLFLGEQLLKGNIKITKLGSLSFISSQGLDILFHGATYFIGFYLITHNSLKVENFIAFLAYAEQFTMAAMSLSQLNSTLQQVMVSINRIFDLMDNLNYPAQSFGEKEIEAIQGNITFENVNFAYTKNKMIFKNLSFEVDKNKKIAFVGISGAGKSTIFNLIQRKYDPFEGRITFDGIDIKEFTEESLRKHIAVVSQDPFLFNTTFKENISISRPDASLEEIQEACRLAHIHDYILSLPDGYETVLGEKAANLSGGQKQRIAIARALLKKSKIILFDEATSSLDNESQYHIKKAIDTIAKDHTILIIAHRLYTISSADEIMIIHEGNITGYGKHQDLIQNNIIYKKLYENELEVINQRHGSNGEQKRASQG